MLNRERKIELCNDFLNRVAYLLGYHYELLPSCNHDISRYLIPSGSKSELSYYGKPHMSLRFSDHWNWFASDKKCSDPNLVQCRSMDMPWARHREMADKSTKPRYGFQVAIYDKTTGCYYHVYGEKFDRQTKTWSWVENDPAKVAADIMRHFGWEVDFGEAEAMKEARHYFLESTWHYPENDDCYETIETTIGPVPLTEALRYMIDWLEKHPMAHTESSMVVEGECVMECCDDISDDGQHSARIEERWD